MFNENELRESIKKHNFVGIICEDGHEHTVKAFAGICGTPFLWFDDELENQMKYCKQISNDLEVEILTADTIEEAVEKDIVVDCGEEHEINHGYRYEIK